LPAAVSWLDFSPRGVLIVSMRLFLIISVMLLTNSAMAAANGPPEFPLHVERGTRYLVDAAGKPFFLVGDNPSSIAVQLTHPEVIQYLDDRKERGFTTLLFEMIEHRFADNPPYNAFGEAPFKAKRVNANGSACVVAPAGLFDKVSRKMKALLGEGACWDFSSPNEAYWQNVDFIVKEAAARGFLLLMTPAYLGYGGKEEGWYQDMVANGPTVLFNYGVFVAERYRAYKNIVWVQGGDFVPPRSDFPLVEAVANGIRSVSPASLQTFYTSRELAARDFWSGAPWFNVNTIYSRWTPHVLAQAQYAASDMPFFLIESYYEGSEGGSEARIRSEAYQAVLTGAFGQIMGNDKVWPFIAGWQQALGSRVAQSMTHLRALFLSRPWWLLRPDDGKLVVSGQSSGESFSPAAIAADKSFALVYFPNGQALGIRIDALGAAHVAARWFDPSSGRYAAIAESPFSGAGTRMVNPPGDNANGYRDWVLVLESEP
jgi:Protein of unknown function (DUF4038)/Putative collagen-binding domain of a collagenase